MRLVPVLVPVLVAAAIASCASDKQPPADDPRARCERLVTKVAAWGDTEEESTHAEKVAFCLEQKIPASYFACIDKAATKDQGDACK
jgi:hypothetical protein